jgi:hypothetical protein
MTDQFVIRKGAYFYRPNSQGYTADIAEAGRYSREEAERLTYPNGPDGPRDGLDFLPAPELPGTNPLADELRARIAAMPQGGTGIFLPIDEIAAIADVLDHQEASLRRARKGEANQWEALGNAQAIIKADEIMIGRLLAVLKLAHHFLMRPVLIPGKTEVRQYLRDYLDLENWGPMPWPQGIPAASHFLREAGYRNVEGYAVKPSAHINEGTPDEKPSADA